MQAEPAFEEANAEVSHDDPLIKLTQELQEGTGNKRYWMVAGAAVALALGFIAARTMKKD